MERVPEPELMEEKEQVISYDEADFSEGEVNLINQINYYKHQFLFQDSRYMMPE